MANGDADWGLWSNPASNILKSFDDQNTRQQVATDRDYQNQQNAFQQQQNQRTQTQQQTGDAALGGIRTQVQNGDLSGAQVAASLVGNKDLATAIGGLSDAHNKKLTDMAGTIGSIASGLMGPDGKLLPDALARYDAAAPALKAHGIDDGEIANVRAEFASPNGNYAAQGYVNSAKNVQQHAAAAQHVADQQFEMGKQHDQQQFELQKPYTLSNGDVRLDGNNQPVAQFGDMTTTGGGTPPASPASTGISRATRNNNPGNVRSLPNGQQWRGQTGVDDGGFAMFGSPLDGQRAADRNLASYGRQGINTVQSIISRWAPPGDRNNTAAYIQSVAKAIGVDPTAPLDMSNPAVRSALLTKGIFPNEGPAAPAQGQQGSHPVTIIHAGPDAADGGLTPESIGVLVDEAIQNGGKVPPGYARMRVLGEVRMSMERVALCRGWGEPHPRQQNSKRPMGGDLLSENLRRSTEPEALARRIIQLLGEGSQVGVGQRSNVGIEG